MKNRQGAKKLYKAHKTWIAAGLAAATLFSVQALGTQTVAADATPAQTETATKTELLNVIAGNKDQFAQQGVGNVTDTVTGKSFYGDLDALKAQVENGTITSKTQLFEALKPVMEGFKEYTKEQFKRQVAAVGNQIYTPTGRTYFGQIDYLFNNATVTSDDDSTNLNLDYSALQDVLDAAKEAASKKTIKIDYINEDNNEVVGQTSYTIDRSAAVSYDQVKENLPKDYRLDTTNKGRYDEANNKYYVPVKATKTIKVDLIDEETNEVLNGLSYTVDKGSGVPAAEVEKELPAGYTIDAANIKYDEKYNKYYVPVKAPSKTIKVDYIDTTTLEVLKQTSYTVASKGGVSRDQIESDVPAGYTIDETQIGWDQANNKYYVGVYKKAKVTPTTTVTTPKTPATPTKTSTSKSTTQAKTAPATKKATKTLPKTGDTTNTVASSIGVVAVIGALFGLAGTTKKRA